MPRSPKPGAPGAYGTSGKPGKPGKKGAAPAAPSGDRAAKVAALQKQARSAERRRGSTIWLVLGGVLLLIVGAVTWAVIDQSRNRPTMGAVQTYENLGREHVDGVKLTYPQHPPVGGDHNSAWWNCGVYDFQLPDYHAVHSLEHGTVWLTYQPGIAAGELDKLTALASQEYMLLSPYEGQEYPVMATAWGHQLGVDSADDTRIEQFIRDYRLGPQTPEPGAACTGGTSKDLVGG